MSGEVWVLKGSGQVLINVHKQGECVGHWCTIHRPLPGLWQDWPMRFVSDIVMVRTCPHGVAHPAIEDVINLLAYPDHDCDGCPCGIEGNKVSHVGTTSAAELEGRDADPDLDAGPGDGSEASPLA